MNDDAERRAIEAARLRFAEIIEAKGLLDVEAAVRVSALTAAQAIGNPTRRDYPIIEGKEVVIEASVNGAKAQAFTDAPRDFHGSLREILELPLTTNQARAIFLATMNATLRSLGMLEATLHCRDDEPEQCAAEIARHVRDTCGEVSVGLIGLNPAIAEALVKAFGPARVRLTDLNRKNIGTERFGVTIWDGRSQTQALIEQSDIVIVTGTTLVNDTFDAIRRAAIARGKQFLIFGVTAAGVCKLLNWERICPYSRRE